MDNNKRIIFLGTPDFAVASLAALVQHNFNVVAVVTAPDKPAGRGMQLQQSDVKKFAVEHNIPVLQPEKLKNPEFIAALRSYKADLQVVVAFRMLPEIVWNMPTFGTINVHASLLPQFRGAAPINWALITGQQTTGVTTFKLKHEIDTGDILLQETVAITNDDDAGSLYDKLKIKGAELLVTTLNQLFAGTLQEKPQTNSQVDLLHAPKIFTETCLINWNNTAESIHHLVRGLSPVPAAFTYLQNKKFKILKSSFVNMLHNYEVGSIVTDHKTTMAFVAKDGLVYVHELQPEGKKRMWVKDYLNGKPFQHLQVIDIKL